MGIEEIQYENIVEIPGLSRTPFLLYPGELRREESTSKYLKREKGKCLTDLNGPSCRPLRQQCGPIYG